MADQDCTEPTNHPRVLDENCQDYVAEALFWERCTKWAFLNGVSNAVPVRENNARTIRFGAPAVIQGVFTKELSLKLQHLTKEEACSLKPEYTMHYYYKYRS